MKKPTILLIEDDPDILELAQYNLERDGFSVSTASDGEEGLRKAQGVKPDLIVLDLMMPGMDGLKVCQKLRASDDTKNTPIIMLTAKGEESDIVIGLEMGADDYMTKPFSPKELIARIRANLRRGPMEISKSSVIEAGPITIHTDRHEVFHRGQPMALTLAEFKIMRMLASKPGRVFTREQLLETISGGDTFLVDRNVDVHIRALRKKLGEDAELIITIRGIGYKCKD